MLISASSLSWRVCFVCSCPVKIGKELKKQFCAKSYVLSVPPTPIPYLFQPQITSISLFFILVGMVYWYNNKSLISTSNTNRRITFSSFPKSVSFWLKNTATTTATKSPEWKLRLSVSSRNASNHHCILFCLKAVNYEQTMATPNVQCLTMLFLS